MTGARVKSGCNGRDCVKVCEHPGVPSPFLGYPHGQAGWEAYLRQSWTPQGKDPRRLELEGAPRGKPAQSQELQGFDEAANWKRPKLADTKARDNAERRKNVFFKLVCN